jgi:hypothetical protein
MTTPTVQHAVDAALREERGRVVATLTARSPRGTFSQAELAGDRVITALSFRPGRGSGGRSGPDGQVVVDLGRAV